MKKGILITLTLVALAGLYTGYWFYQKQQLEKRILTELDIFEKEHPNVKIKHEGIAVKGYPFNFYVDVTNPHLTWIQTSGYTLRQAPEIYLIGKMIFSSNLQGHVNKMSTDGDLHFIFDMENRNGISKTNHFLLSGKTEEQISRNTPVDKSLVAHLKAFIFGSVDVKDLTVSYFENDQPLKLAEISQAHLDTTSAEHNSKQKITLKANYKGKIFNENLHQLLYGTSIPFWENYKIENSTQTAEIILEMPKFEELAKLLESEPDPKKIPEFYTFMNSTLESDLYKSKASLTIDFKNEGISDQYIVFKTDGDIVYSDKGKVISKQLLAGAIAYGVNSKPKEGEVDPSTAKIQEVFEEAVRQPQFVNLLGNFPDFIKYNLDMNLKYSKDPFFQDTKIEIKELSFAAPKSNLKVNLFNETNNFAQSSFKAILNLHNPKAIIHTQVSFYNRLADLLNPILAKREDLDIKHLPVITAEAEEDLVDILQEFSDKPDNTMDLTLSFINNESEGFMVGSRSGMELFMALFGFYNQHFITEQ